MAWRGDMSRRLTAQSSGQLNGNAFARRRMNQRSVVPIVFRYDIVPYPQRYADHFQMKISPGEMA
jgi:hypothetical protein